MILFTLILLSYCGVSFCAASEGQKQKAPLPSPPVRITASSAGKLVFARDVCSPATFIRGVRHLDLMRQNSENLEEERKKKEEEKRVAQEELKRTSEPSASESDEDTDEYVDRHVSDEDLFELEL